MTITLKNKKFRSKIFCFDLDNVLCKTKGSNYKKSLPLKENIRTVNILSQKGNYIKIFTSRYMGRNKENKNKAIKDGYNFTKKQLKKWNVKYDELIFGKPSYDLFVDDKNLSFKKNWSKLILNLLKKNKI